MKTLTVYSRKGGSGKTVLSLLLAKFLQSSGAKVLVIDNDPQGSITGHLMRLSGGSRPEIKTKNILSLFEETISLEDSIIDAGGVSLIAYSPKLLDYQTSLPVRALKNILSGLKGFDYVIIDNNPSWSLLVQASLMASDTALLPSLVSIDDLEQTLWTFNKVQSSSDCKRFVFLNQYKDTNAGEMSKVSVDYYSEKFGESVIKEITLPQTKLIREYTDIGEKITNKAKNKIGVFDAISGLAKIAFGVTAQPEAF